GRFEQASGGTIFLDELGEIPLSTQTKLLRTLQEKVIEPVGSNKSLKIDTRIIAATNKNLKTMVDNGTFRQDLYFRLNVFPVTVPPLRERISDIPLLIKHFIKKYAFSFGKNIQAADDDYIEILKNYSFPGNIRELENIVERSIILTSGDKLTSDTLPALDTNNNLTLKNTEKQSIIDALKHSEGNKTNAAKLLGISRRALYYKLEQYNLTDL
ncbi:MAG: sigma-54-dependent Fis family transcriptional regulator, partial [Deferribacterales bacterium]|nr:sigma-54-dependent Fis family transcriptional regulator [Deferribacterales bacterium]